MEMAGTRPGHDNVAECIAMSDAYFRREIGT
jgi:hypothetical protein